MGGKVIFNKTNGEQVTKMSSFLLGDIVRIEDIGCCYTIYCSAFEHFSITQSKPKNYHTPNGTEVLSVSNVHKNTNWVVCGIALHSHYDSIIYYIRNKYNEHLLINKYGLILRKACSDKNRTSKRIFNQIPLKRY